MMFPCPKCLSKSRVTHTTCTYEEFETVIKRRHVCKVCKHEFIVDSKTPYKPTKQESIDLARRVKAQLNAMDLTQEQFSKRTGIHIDTLKSWFSDTNSSRFREIPVKYFKPLKEFCIKGYIFAKNRG